MTRYRGVTMTSIPGADRWRWWLAKSMSACDTAGMATLSRALAGAGTRSGLPRLSLGLAMVLLLAAYVVGVQPSQVTLGGVVAAVALVGIAGSGLLYAWRLGAGGIVD